jgi:predicted ATPase
MELVYLWVEDYKNIHKQGFNFSPRFECAYDEDTYELKIEKKEYTSIFPDDINVTAIVGENGSGKSSVLESILDLLSNSSNEKDRKKYLLFYKHNSDYIVFKSHINSKINIVDSNNTKITWIKENPNSKFLTWHRDIISIFLTNEREHKVFEDENQIYVETPQRNINRIKKIILSNYVSHKKSLKKLNDKYFTPININIKLQLYKLLEDEYLYEEDINKKVRKIIKEIEDTDSASEKFSKIINIFKIKKDLSSLKTKPSFLSINKNDLTSLKIQSKYNYFSYVEKERYSIDEIYKRVFKSLTKPIKKKNIFYSFDINELTPEYINFLFDLPELVFDIELLDKDIKFEDLSYGERQLLIQLHFILHHSQKTKYQSLEIIANEVDDEKEEVIENKINSMFILLDEFEVGLHPEWQKKAIEYIIVFLENLKIKFHLIITSHSPFILSDLPKKNVIFLEKGKQVDVDIETFGANIHTLLSHGFFMKDGLMGEFAKRQINDAISRLNQTKLSEDDIKFCENIIKITGEPIIKRQMQKMLDSKRLTKIDAVNKKIADMSYELELLKKHQAKFVKDELKDRAKKQYQQRKQDDKNR